MTLDVVVPTFNRRDSLRRTLLSVLKMPLPEGHTLEITVADNNSTDGTREEVEALKPLFGGRLRYVLVDQGQGRSFALNAGILATHQELIGFVDDDEELDPHWAKIVYEAFANYKTDYVGGRYQPVSRIPFPPWATHPHTRTGIGWADFGPAVKAFEEEGCEAILMGGNSIIRRRCVERIGLYSEALGRSGTRLLGGEDADMQQRLVRAGFHGLYLPTLVVYHHISPERLTKKYMRRWAFWTSVSVAQVIRERPESGLHWLGLPRHMSRQSRARTVSLDTLRSQESTG